MLAIIVFGIYHSRNQHLYSLNFFIISGIIWNVHTACALPVKRFLNKRWLNRNLCCLVSVWNSYIIPYMAKWVHFVLFYWKT